MFGEGHFFFAWALQGFKLAQGYLCSLSKSSLALTLFCKHELHKHKRNRTTFPKTNCRINGAATRSSQIHCFEITSFQSRRLAGNIHFSTMYLQATKQTITQASDQGPSQSFLFWLGTNSFCTAMISSKPTEDCQSQRTPTPKGNSEHKPCTPRPLVCINLNSEPTGQSVPYYKLIEARLHIFGD